MKENLMGEFTVSIKIEDTLGDWWFIGLYGLCKASVRSDFCHELAGLQSICGNKWCIGGDFNVIKFLEEKNNNQRVSRSMKNFDELIRELGLSDPPLLNA